MTITVDTTTRTVDETCWTVDGFDGCAPPTTAVPNKRHIWPVVRNSRKR